MPSPLRVVLVPGFLSPAWMFVPLERSLRRAGLDAVRWDAPKVFVDPAASVAALRDDLTRDGSPIAVVSHSFGDWLARRAIAGRDCGPIERLISIAPVTTRLPLTPLVRQARLDRVPELRVMTDSQAAEVPIAAADCRSRLVLWPTVELIVARALPPGDTVPTEERRIVGTHNSLPWQPGVHRLIAQTLARP